MFLLKYIWQEMQLQPKWYMGLFLTNGLLLHISGLLMERILRQNDSFEITLHCILLAPLLMLLACTVLLPLYLQKERNDLLIPEYRALLRTEVSHEKIVFLQCMQTSLLSLGALLVSAPLSTLTMRYLRRLEGDPLWQNGWRNRSTLPFWMLIYVFLLAASLLCCIYVNRRKQSALQQDPCSKGTTARQILRSPGLPMYAKLRRNRVRHEGRHICTALVLLCILPVLFSILLTGHVFPSNPYVPDNTLYLSMTDNHPNAISTFLLTQIEQVEGVTLEKAYMPTETTPPSYRSAVFRLDVDTWQESAAEVRRILEHDRSAPLLQISIPLEYTLQNNAAQEDTANLLYLLLLFFSACALCFTGTGMLLLQYLHGRQEELQVLSAFGMGRRDGFGMLGQTVFRWLTFAGVFSLLSGSLVMILYDGITYNYSNRNAVLSEIYRVSPESLRLFFLGGSGFLLLLLFLGILFLLRFLQKVCPDIRPKQKIVP